MKKVINIDEWIRKEHFQFFSQFEEPFFGATVTVDCTIAYARSKEMGVSFFLYYLYRALKAANTVENFRYRVIDNSVYLFDQVNASPTIGRPNGTFGFAYMDYNEDESLFYKNAVEETERVQSTTNLLPSTEGLNVIHCSAIPWLDFTSLSHARSFSFPDSCPKISFGKVTEKDGLKSMPVAIYVHHGLADGYHVGLFVDKFQELLNI